MSTNQPTRWSLFELTATYYQDSDCNEIAEPGQELKITAESNGAGQFLTLSTRRWAISGPSELQALLADFIGRGAGLPLEQVTAPAPVRQSPLADMIFGGPPNMPATIAHPYLCDKCGHVGEVFDDCTQPGCSGMYTQNKPESAPEVRYGPSPEEFVAAMEGTAEPVMLARTPSAPEPEQPPLTHEAINAGETPTLAVEPAPAPKPIAKLRPAVHRWTAQENAAFDRDYPHKSNAELADQFGRSVRAITLHAVERKLKKAVKGAASKPAPAPKPTPTAPTPAAARLPAARLPAAAPQPEKEISAGLEARLMKVVDKLGLKKLQSMDEHDARQALQLLTDNRSVLAWVPGAQRLLERLSGHFSLPVRLPMERSQAHA